MAHSLTGELDNAMKAIEVLAQEGYRIGQMAIHNRETPDIILAFQGGTWAISGGECCI